MKTLIILWLIFISSSISATELNSQNENNISLLIHEIQESNLSCKTQKILIEKLILDDKSNNKIINSKFHNPKNKIINHNN